MVDGKTKNVDDTDALMDGRPEAARATLRRVVQLELSLTVNDIVFTFLSWGRAKLALVLPRGHQAALCHTDHH